MAAAVVERPGRIRIDDAPLPEPGPGQVRVRLQGCGVCGSNVPPWSGREWFKYPMQPGQLGHEGWGRIDALGPGVADLREGQRVAMLTDYCFAEYAVSNAASVVPLPGVLDNVPFPGEPLACAFNVMARSDVQPGQTVAIVGIGFLGALLTKLCTEAGARVVAISRRPFALSVARRMGAQAVLAMELRRQLVETVQAMTGGAMCPRVIEATGKQAPLDLASELTATRGRLIIAGYHQDGPRQVDMQNWNWRGIDVVNAHERDPAVYVAGLRRAIDAVAAGRLDPAPLYTHHYPLANLADALDATRLRPEGFLKSLIYMEKARS